IKLRYVDGRTFSCPWNVCKTWNGMEKFIQQISQNDQVEGHFIQDGLYDLIGPSGTKVPEHAWEVDVRP
ncbi:uncharacterized protein IWZ02DRAFT_352309, partial [Phyllosticta citriasiana]